MDPSAPMAGQVLAGRYRLGRLLGDGRTGQVFQARDSETQDRVAVKLLHRPLCSVEEEVRRFSREFDVTRDLVHPNVVRGLAFGKATDGPLAGTHFLVMELLEGRRLDEVLAQGPLPPDRAARIALDVARALQSAHDRGVVHRDVKPGNVVLVRKGGPEVARVMDFGLARLQGGTEDLTDIGVRLGTAEYMSPEYVEDGEIDGRADLYALGVMLFEMLTGTPPFVGRSLKVMQDHVTSPVPRIGQRVPGLPHWLEDLVTSLLAKDPDQRPQTASQVAAALEAGMPSLDAEQREERAALASAPAPPPPEAMSSVGHRGESHAPVYPDPKPLPPVPLALGVAMIGFGMLGLAGLAGLAIAFALAM